MSIPLGEIIYIAVKPIFKIYLIIAVGIILSKKNILTVETSRNISSIAINVLIPCLAFQKIVSNISNNDIHQISTIVIISFFMMGLGSILCFSFGVAAGCPKQWWGGLICCGLLPNISDVPIAYLQTMQSSTIFNNTDKGVSYIIIYLTLQMLVQFNFGAFKLIEMDFQTEAKINAKKKKYEQINKDTEKELLPDPEVIIRSSSTSSRSNATGSILSSALSHSQNVNMENRSIQQSDCTQTSLESSISLTQSQNEALQPVLRTSSKKTNSSSVIRNTEPLSRTLSIPQVMLNNDTVNAIPEDMNDIVRVYSKFNLLEPIKADVKQSKDEANFFLSNLITYIKSINYKHLFKTIIKLWIASSLKIVSITLVLSITICMIPWVQALFVVTPQAHLPPAPDGDPPLSFIMDFAGYIGAAEVPFGLLLLGGTIGRLNFLKIPLKVWRVPIAVTFCRLFIMPIIGCAFNSKIFSDGLFYNESILYFISNINFCLPPATSLLYITAFYTPIDDQPHLQMDYLALIYIFHYIFLVVCLPFTTTYTLKVPLHS
jgi:predicted permease